ncbi:FAD/NAD(P)-binding domain-containing protein [Durotheca rogersii]|uniref:FAD/NAD(P)-binding domain-containing protein n=1 Tax=Durotheca rogersii TaxID=419775 RepID=UPI00221F26AA|nr:FAD/NAD(P)-binding domain-containing protein [Durotheca rogersii]KAI5860963.1 FAD/NAD(P)-binding domain-containing protein [Durotheca rogersii]
MVAAKRVAVIGTGPAGAIAIDALAKEKAFDIIRVFERREGPGGCWIGDPTPPLAGEDGNLDLLSLGERTADRPVPIPERLPAQTPRSDRPRFTESSIYPYLETNIDAVTMEFNQEPIPVERTARSVSIHGTDTPFRHWTVIRRYIEGLIQRRGYQDLVSYNTTVERAEKIGNEWKLTLRRKGRETDYWWSEYFDAVVVASGHYSVPYIPLIEGLAEFAKERPGSVIHSKHFRGRDAFRDKRVIVVGASVSAADIAVDLVPSAETPVHAVVIGHNANIYFGDEAFQHPKIQKHPSITRITGRTVHFADESSVADIDHIIFGTGYTWTLPFLPDVKVANNRVQGLYQHVVYREDPSLVFVGAVNAGLTFKIFEWQAVLAARVLAGRAKLPPVEGQRRWEAERVKVRGDGPKFALVFPDFEDYFETVRKLAGPGEDGLGRQLPPFRKEWLDAFYGGHERRKRMWRRLNEEAADRTEAHAKL